MKINIKLCIINFKEKNEKNKEEKKKKYIKTNLETEKRHENNMVQLNVEREKLAKETEEKEIKAMKIDDIEKNTNELKERINKGEISDYTVNTFTTLCGKAIEHFSMIGNDKYMEYVEMMKKVLQMEKVNKLTIDDEKEIKEHANNP